MDLLHDFRWACSETLPLNPERLVDGFSPSTVYATYGRLADSKSAPGRIRTINLFLNLQSTRCSRLYWSRPWIVLMFSME
jgi:hypothetical protein